MILIILNWIASIIAKPIMDMVNDGVFSQAFIDIFFMERLTGLSDDLVTNIMLIIAGFASGLMTVKLLYKLVSVYILKTEGDSTISAIDYLKNYCKGIIVTLTFTIAYQWIHFVINEIAQSILEIIGTHAISKWVDISSLSSFALLVVVIYLIFFLIIYINFLVNGVRMLILRLGISFACIGLIDGDKGLYGVFIKKIFQTAITVLVQMILVQLSLLPMQSTSPLVNLAAIALLSYSLKIPSDLNDIFIANAASGMGQKVSSAAQGAQVVSSFFRKGR